MLTTEILKAALRHGVEHVVFFSSGGTVYGPTSREPIAESHATNPIGCYGVTKLAAEKYVSVFASRHGLRASILRCSNPYGERQDPRASQGAVTVFLNRAATGEPIQIWGDGEVVRDYIHVSDLVEAAARVVERGGEPVTLLNVGSGVGVSLNELVATIRRVTGLNARVAYQAARPVDVPWNVLDIREARSLLRYAPTISLDAGVGRTWQWLRELERRGQPAR